MTKKVKLLLVLLLVLSALVLFLIFTSASVKKPETVGQPVKSDNMILPDEAYMAKVKEISDAYESLEIQGKSITIKDIRELKNKLLGLNVPTKFKDLHLKFVLYLTQLEDYINQKDEQGKNANFQMYDQLRADYGWLNN